MARKRASRKPISAATYPRAFLRDQPQALQLGLFLPSPAPSLARTESAATAERPAGANVFVIDLNPDCD